MAMKLHTVCLLAALAVASSACEETTTVWGDWRSGQDAGACRPALFSDKVMVKVASNGTVVASDEVPCDDLGFSLDIPADVTHVHVTAVDAWGGTWDKEFDVTGGYLYVGVILFDHT